MRRCQVFDVKILYTLPEYLGLMLGFYPQTKFGVKASETPLLMNFDLPSFIEPILGCGPQIRYTEELGLFRHLVEYGWGYDAAFLFSSEIL